MALLQYLAATALTSASACSFLVMYVRWGEITVPSLVCMLVREKCFLVYACVCMYAPVRGDTHGASKAAMVYPHPV